MNEQAKNPLVLQQSSLAKHSSMLVLRGMEISDHLGTYGEAEHFLQYSNEAFDQSDWDRSFQYLSLAIDAAPRWWKPYHARACLCALKGMMVEALSDINRAIELAPSEAVLFSTRGSFKFQLDDFAECSSDLAHALRLDATLADVYMMRGILTAALDSPEAAIPDFDRAIALGGSLLPFSYYHRGTAYHEAGQFTRAMQDYNEAISLAPTDWNAYYHRGLAKSSSDDWTGAIADFSIVIQLNPEYDPAFYARGMCKEKLGDLPSALLDLDLAIRLNPNNAHYFFHRASIKVQEGKLGESLHDFCTALRLDPDNPEIYVRRGVTYQLQENWSNAAADFQIYLRFHPNDVVVLEQFSIAQVMLGDIDGALNHLNRAISLQPEAYKLRLRRADIFYGMNQLAHALADLDAAIQLSPSTSECYRTRAIVRHEIGDWVGSQIDFERIESLQTRK